MKLKKISKIMITVMVTLILLVSVLPVNAALKADAIPYGTPKIDGKIDGIWDGASNKVAVDMYFDGETSGYATGYARLLWDEKNLYVLGYAYDTTKSIKVGEEQWYTDGFEVFLDERNAHNTVKNEISQIRVSRKGVLSGMLMSAVVTEKGILAEYKGTEWKAAEASDGYFVEIAIPWTRAKNVGNGTQIGIEFQINDDFNNDGKIETVINSEVVDKWSPISYRMMTLVSTKAEASSDKDTNSQSSSSKEEAASKPSNTTSSNNSQAATNNSTTQDSSKPNSTASADKNTTSKVDKTESVVESESTTNNDNNSETVDNKTEATEDEAQGGLPKSVIIAIAAVSAFIIIAIVICLIVLLKPKKKK